MSVNTVPYTSAINAFYAKRTAEAAKAAGTAPKPVIDTVIKEGDSVVVRAAKKKAAAEEAALAKKNGTYTSPDPIDEDTDTSDDTPVQAALKARKKVTSKSNAKGEESEDFLRMKAFEIKNRIATYKTLGLEVQYAQAQQEGVEVIQKYQALLQKAAAAKKTVTDLKV